MDHKRGCVLARKKKVSDSVELLNVAENPLAESQLSGATDAKTGREVGAGPLENEHPGMTHARIG
jgi:hypothetical protein